MKTTITIETNITAPVDLVWSCWTLPEHITQWNAASDDWHTPTASNDLRVGGRFTSRMESKDGLYGFDFWGTHEEVHMNKLIKSTMGDGRKMDVHFILNGSQVKVIESFETEDENSIELQKQGWQAILDRFKAYVDRMPNQQNETK
jgi:uncharacterized protein YndB with AHSA1/START domain